jgi:hypothetical protein
MIGLLTGRPTQGGDAEQASALREAERSLIVVRTLGAAAIFGAVLLLRDSFPGYLPVLGGCAFILAYNALLVVPLYRRSAEAARDVGVLLDLITVAATSVAVAMAERSAGVRSDIWVCFIVLVAVSSLRFGSRAALGHALFWCAWALLFTGISGASWGDGAIRLAVMLTVAAAVFLVTERLRDREEMLAKSNALLEEQSRETLIMLAGVVEARDEMTGQHLHRIEGGVRRLALELGFRPHEAAALGEAAVMHDVGKAGVPDRILLKPGPLTEAEWGVIQKHTVLGEAILGERKDFALARQIARSHHEHWDGSGYPGGLAGEAIPLAARIVAVVDMFDALISRRPYKEAWPPEDALREMERVRGAQLDPEIVERFILLVRSGELDGEDMEAAA